MKKKYNALELQIVMMEKDVLTFSRESNDVTGNDIYNDFEE